MGGEIVAVTGSQSPALLSSARRSVLDRATAPQSSALRNPDTRWGSRGDLRPLMGAEVVTPEETHPYRPGAGHAGSQRVRGLVLAGHVSGRACGFPGEPVVR